MLSGVAPPQLEAALHRDALFAHHIPTLFAGLDATEALVLAVSGGPDSMALMLLVDRWARARGAAPVLHVATVDHGLRPDSRCEAALVAEAAGALGLSCATLAWTGPKPSTGLQERARAARYALLADHARAIGAAAILTAHHADDQAETVLMRLARGSGLGGLAGMRRETELAPGLLLIRPLLDVPKRDLVALCRREGQCTVEDPSNHDPAYDRARLRAEAAALERLGLDRATLLRLARRMACADAALEAVADRLLQTLTPELASGHSQVDLAAARAAEPEILLRLLRRVIVSVVGAQRTIRLDRLEALTEAIQAALCAGRKHRATLAGARITLGCDAMLDMTLEPERRRGQCRPHENPRRRRH